MFDGASADALCLVLSLDLSEILVADWRRRLLSTQRVLRTGAQGEEPSNHQSSSGKKWHAIWKPRKNSTSKKGHNVNIVGLIIFLFCVLRYDMISIYLWLFLVLLVRCCFFGPQTLVFAMFGCDSVLVSFHLLLFGLAAFVWSSYAWIFLPAVNLFFCHWLRVTGL